MLLSTAVDRAGPHNRELSGPDTSNAEVQQSPIKILLFLIYNEETEAQSGYKSVWGHIARSEEASRA